MQNSNSNQGQAGSGGNTGMASGGQQNALQPKGGQQGDSRDQDSGSQRPAGGETLARAAQGAHRAVDATVEKVAPVVDAVHARVESARSAAQGAKDTVSNVQDQLGAAKDQAGAWIGAARETIVQNPFAAIAGAFLIGAAYAASRRR